MSVHEIRLQEGSERAHGHLFAVCGVVGVFGPYAGHEERGYAFTEHLEEGESAFVGQVAGLLVGKQRLDGAVAQLVERHNESFVAVGVEVDDEVAECAKLWLLGVISEQES